MSVTFRSFMCHTRTEQFGNRSRSRKRRPCLKIIPNRFWNRRKTILGTRRRRRNKAGNGLSENRIRSARWNVSLFHFAPGTFRADSSWRTGIWISITYEFAAGVRDEISWHLTLERFKLCTDEEAPPPPPLNGFNAIFSTCWCIIHGRRR